MTRLPDLAQRSRLVELLQSRGLVIAALVLLDVFEVLDEVGDVIVIVISSARWPLLALLNCLVGLGELAEGRERIRTELVENARDELSELLNLAGTVDGESVGRNGGVDWGENAIR